MANAAMTRPAVRPVSAPWPAMPLFARPMSRHTYAHSPPTRTYVRSLARWARGPWPSNSRSRMSASPAPSARVLCGSDVPRAYAPAMPRRFMMSTMRLPEAVTPLRSSAALIFPAPQRSWPSRRTARTSPAIGSTRPASGCTVIQ